MEFWVGFSGFSWPLFSCSSARLLFVFGCLAASLLDFWSCAHGARKQCYQRRCPSTVHAQVSSAPSPRPSCARSSDSGPIVRCPGRGVWLLIFSLLLVVVFADQHQAHQLCAFAQQVAVITVSQGDFLCLIFVWSRLLLASRGDVQLSPCCLPWILWAQVRWCSTRCAFRSWFREPLAALVLCRISSGGHRWRYQCPCVRDRCSWSVLRPIFLGEFSVRAQSISLVMIFCFACSLVVWAPNCVPPLALVSYHSEKFFMVLSSLVGLGISVCELACAWWWYWDNGQIFREKFYDSHSPLVAVFGPSISYSSSCSCISKQSRYC
jgi:hypothetical protein